MDNFTPKVLFLLFLLSIVILYLIIRQKPRSRSPTLPSLPNKLPVIGHLHLFKDHKPHETFAKLAEKLGPIFYVQLGPVPAVVVTSNELSKHVLKTHDQVFASRPNFLSAQYISVGPADVTFSPYGVYWRQARKICVTELLSTKRANSFKVVLDDEVNRFLANVKAHSGSEIDISDLIFSFTTDFFCLAAFGLRFMEGPDEGRKSKYLASVFTEAEELLTGFYYGDLFSVWGWPGWLTGHTQRVIKGSQNLLNSVEEIFEKNSKRKQATSALHGNEDFIDVLRRVQKRDDLDVPLTDDNIKAIVSDMFVAGVDPSTAAQEWIMTDLARHPRVMKKAREEVRRVASGSGRVDESHIQQLKYMKAVIKESMRLHPVCLLIPRESSEKCVFEGYEIPAKTRILINNYAIARDPNLFEKPHDFIPERFEQEDITDYKEQEFRFLPFGGGRRGCPGYSFGSMTVELVVARLLYHFDWSLPHGVGPDDVDLQAVFGLAARRRIPLVLVPTVNKDYEFK